ncbi:MAG: hypothetical protein AYP45_13790 [Candidatus Brocadia carolinensis]|uniref:Nucleotidyltransferase family protein n=1 Tax=Candidatus Brocadia carolinensis TaxID=1004156 RepID=A0A1V4AR62_9BACT|nr:MAG: hypothetical protein AYP45_13790 [Candidatus Brocadia caroliniensis]
MSQRIRPFGSLKCPQARIDQIEILRQINYGEGLPKDFKEFFTLLNANGVEYLLIGGYAVGYHGYPRATNDIDIWIAMNQENAGKLMKVLKEFGFDTPEFTSELFLQKDRMVRLGMPPM